jgi:hypothetical protein
MHLGERDRLLNWSPFVSYVIEFDAWEMDAWFCEEVEYHGAHSRPFARHEGPPFQPRSFAKEASTQVLRRRSPTAALPFRPVLADVRLRLLTPTPCEAISLDLPFFGIMT